MEFAASTEAFQGNTHGSVTPESYHNSFDEHTTIYETSHEYAHSSRRPGCVQDGLDSWLLEGPTCSSPLSTSSSLSASEGVATPPSYTSQLPQPLYHLNDQQLQQCTTDSISCGTFENTDDNSWQLNYSTDGAWSVQAFASTWPNTAYGNLALPLLEPYNSSMPIVAAPVFSFPGPSHLVGQFVDSTPFQVDDKASSEASSDMSEADSDDSDYEELGSNTHKQESQSGTRNASGLLQLGRWDLTLDNYNRPEQRHYGCPLIGQPDLKGVICTKRFVRPEHLRRHIKTVHGDDRDYTCKVPQCRRAFSRGDNLRDHYWTHIYRGGRQGRNDKMTIAELKDILGPKERKLIKRLKLKLARTREKQLRAKRN